MKKSMTITMIITIAVIILTGCHKGGITPADYSTPATTAQRLDQSNAVNTGNNGNWVAQAQNKNYTKDSLSWMHNAPALTPGTIKSGHLEQVTYKTWGAAGNVIQVTKTAILFVDGTYGDPAPTSYILPVSSGTGTGGTGASGNSQ